MKSAEIIEKAAFDGVVVSLSADGKLSVSGNKKIVTNWTPVLLANKAGLLAELNLRRRHAKILSMLGDGRRYAVLFEDDTTDPVIVTCAIRGIASFELAIPHHSYNGLILLELLDKHSQSYCEVNPSPTSNRPSPAHPARRSA